MKVNLPSTYEEWRDCIEIQCQIPLTLAFVQERLQVYEDVENEERMRFIRLYGESHLNNIITWFKHACL